VFDSAPFAPRQRPQAAQAKKQQRKILEASSSMSS